MRDNWNVFLYLLGHGIVRVWDAWDHLRGKGRYSL